MRARSIGLVVELSACRYEPSLSLPSLPTSHYYNHPSTIPSSLTFIQLAPPSQLGSILTHTPPRAKQLPC
jgi:hypothetical protein